MIPRSPAYPYRRLSKWEWLGITAALILWLGQSLLVAFGAYAVLMVIAFIGYIACCTVH